MKIKLKGMTWDHDRGYLPLLKASEIYTKTNPHVEISWDKRSLQAFADRPLDVMAKEYDLLVIDHPHIGAAIASNAIINFNDKGYEKELLELKNNSMGPSHMSYNLQDKQWALAIDTASQVSCYRPDKLTKIPKNWNEVIKLSQENKVLFPLKPVDAIDSFFTMCANFGEEVALSKSKLISEKTATIVLNIMKELSENIPKDCLHQNPIEVLEILSDKNTKYSYCPLLFGYSNYSRDNYRDKLVKFTNIPSFSKDHVKGSIIGGTGIAISSQCKHIHEALKYSFMIASENYQKNEYTINAGQPAHKLAWEDDAVNRLSHDFFKNTKDTLDSSWLRPRYSGFLYLADKGGDLINDFLQGKISLENTLKQLEIIYQKSLT